MEPIPPTKAVLQSFVDRGDAEVEGTLLDMGRRARDIVPQCVGLSLAMLQDGGLTLTLAASDEEIAALDAIQYLDGGPCVDAAHEAEVVDVDEDDILSEDRWKMYAQLTAATGVASSLTLPIVERARVIGSVNLYAATPDAFEGHHDALAEALGASAQHAITNADLSFSTRLAAAQSPTRLADQDDIDIAVGIIAANHEVDIPTAQRLLREAAARAGIRPGQAARAIQRILHPDQS
jgi:GAF domain-containing protein